MLLTVKNTANLKQLTKHENPHLPSHSYFLPFNGSTQRN